MRRCFHGAGWHGLGLVDVSHGESLLCSLSGGAGCNCWEVGFIFPVGLSSTYQVWMTVLAAQGEPYPRMHV